MISVKEIKKCKKQQIRTGFFSVFFVYDKWIFVEYQTVLAFYFLEAEKVEFYSSSHLVSMDKYFSHIGILLIV